MTTKAFNGDVAVREAAVDRLRVVAASEKLTGGVLVWDGEQGSVAGALGGTSDAEEWERRLGLPRWFANALDTMTQPLSPGDAVAETRGILAAVSPGRDLEGVGSVVMAMLLNEVTAAAQPDGALSDALSDIIVLHHRCMRGELVSPAEWRKARAAAGRALEACVPAEGDEEDDVSKELQRVRAVGAAVEAAAWDPARSPSALSDVIRQWLKLESLKSDDEFGWTQQDFALVRLHLQELYDEHFANNPEAEQVGNTVFDLLEKHRPEVHARLKAYEQHGAQHHLRCAERACALFRSHLLKGEGAPG